MSQLSSHYNPDIQHLLQIMGLGDTGDDMLNIGIIGVIGDAYGLVSQHLRPAHQLGGNQLAIAECGVSVQIDHGASLNAGHDIKRSYKGLLSP